MDWTTGFRPRGLHRRDGPPGFNPWIRSPGFDCRDYTAGSRPPGLTARFKIRAALRPVPSTTSGICVVLFGPVVTSHVVSHTSSRAEGTNARECQGLCRLFRGIEMARRPSIRGAVGAWASLWTGVHAVARYVCRVHPLRADGSVTNTVVGLRIWPSGRVHCTRGVAGCIAPHGAVCKSCVFMWVRAVFQGIWQSGRMLCDEFHRGSWLFNSRWGRGSIEPPKTGAEG